MSELPPYLRIQPDGASVQIRVVPRASRNELGGVLGDRLKIKIAAPPVDSAANEELIAFLAKRLGLSRGAIRITQGQTSRNKTLLVHGLSAAAAAAALTGSS